MINVRAFLIIFFSINASGQTLMNLKQQEFSKDSIALAKATKYLDHEVGHRYFKNHLEFYGLYHISLFNFPFKFVTYKINNSKCKLHKTIIAVVVDDSLGVDVGSCSITKRKIRNCIAGETFCDFYMDSIYAKSIAFKYLTSKKQVIKMSFMYVPNYTNRIAFNPCWVFQNSYGKIVSINALSGESYIRMRPKRFKGIK